MSRTKLILSYAIPIVILLFFLFGSFFAPHDPTATNIRDKYLSSSAEYPFGTDDFGRCELSLCWASFLAFCWQRPDGAEILWRKVF